MRHRNNIDNILGYLAKRTGSPSGHCPTFEEITAFLQGLQTGAELENTQIHLVGCDKCRELVSEIRLTEQESFRFPLRLPPGLKAVLREKGPTPKTHPVLELVYLTGRKVLRSLGLEGDLQILPVAPVRGMRTASASRLEVGGQPVLLMVNPRANGSYEFWIRLEGTHETVPPHRWQLWKDEKLVGQQTPEDRDTIFSEILPGHYTCILFMAGSEIGMFRIRIGEEDGTEDSSS